MLMLQVLGFHPETHWGARTLLSSLLRWGNSEVHVPRRLYQSAWAVDKYHTGQPEQQKLIFSQFWSLEVQEQVVSRVGFA